MRHLLDARSAPRCDGALRVGRGGLHPFDSLVGAPEVRSASNLAHDQREDSRDDAWFDRPTI